MTQANIRPLSGRTQANWIRLRTMIMLRWVAIGGQLVAITVAQVVYELQLELGLCYLAVGASIIANLVSTFIFPENKRLSERQNFALVFFDLLQLAVLLFLTGGLHNPFALLLLGPVTITASALSLRSTVVLCGTALIIVTVLALAHFPLVTKEGEVLRIPGIFVFGHWVGLIIALVFTSAYSWRVSSEIHTMGDALAATQMALAREQKLTDLGGVVAAAAHELGTPLATIKLTSAELLNDLADQPDLAEDAQLIRDQADRCRDILRNMGRAGKDDVLMRQAPLEAVIMEAAEPHMDRGKAVIIAADVGSNERKNQPLVLRKPEVVHGLRNLVQNAVDFAESEVRIEPRWSPAEITLRIIDDGPGFPAQVLSRIGDPFVRRRSQSALPDSRPEYEGMGLGLFIAKTLLERTGAQLRFANGATFQQTQKRTGALVEVTWPRHALAPDESADRRAMGENPVIQT